MAVVAQIIHRFFQLVLLIVLIDVVLSYFVSPYNKIRMFLDRLVNPMLAPIRRFVRPIGGLDLSPIILLILIQVVDYILTSILLSL